MTLALLVLYWKFLLNKSYALTLLKEISLNLSSFLSSLKSVITADKSQNFIFGAIKWGMKLILSLNHAELFKRSRSNLQKRSHKICLKQSTTGKQFHTILPRSVF